MYKARRKRNHRKPRDLKQWWRWYSTSVELIVGIALIMVIALSTIATNIQQRVSAKELDSHIKYISTQMKSMPARNSYDCDVSEEALQSGLDAQAKDLAEREEMAAEKVEYSATPASKIYDTEALSADLQQYAKTLCDENDFSLPVFMSLMWKESTYDPSQISADGHDKGLCQIRDENYSWLEDNLGDLDFFNGKDSMKASMFMLNDIRNNYGISDIHSILMYYNMGPGNAKKCLNSGIYSSDYSRQIITHAESLGY